MKGVVLFSALGYENSELTETKIVFVKYDLQYSNLPKYKQPCKKVIFNMASKTLICKSRNEKGNNIDFPVEVDEFKAIQQTVNDLGWA